MTHNLMRIIVFIGGLLVFLFGCGLFVYSIFTPGFDPIFVVGILFALGGAALASCLGEE